MTIKGYFFEFTSWLPPELSLTLWTTVKIMTICVPLMLSVAYLTFAERKIIGIFLECSLSFSSEAIL